MDKKDITHQKPEGPVKQTFELYKAGDTNPKNCIHKIDNTYGPKWPEDTDNKLTNLAYFKFEDLNSDQDDTKPNKKGEDGDGKK